MAEGLTGRGGRDDRERISGDTEGCSDRGRGKGRDYEITRRRRRQNIVGDEREGTAEGEKRNKTIRSIIIIIYI